jgi:hypothetical protein
MNRHLSTFLLSLLLLAAAACSKDNKDPEPSLEGRWLEAYSQTLDYNSDNVLYQDYGRVAIVRPFVHKFTSTSVMGITYELRNGTYVPTDSVETAYTRVGNTIQFTAASLTYELTKLTKTDLVLERDERITNGGRRHIIFEFTRK